ncbi:uncharacterized protein LOC142950945 isoform X2 [Anarhichas minor]|uniref:uncharacterized protein LOC142950945 isoform X2 n=1 Tax=Anarhichas minor TaxID=65739 RepID=UPI003F7334A8
MLPSPVTLTQRRHYGLYNQGATCYLNSVLQVLSMTTEIHDRLDPTTKQMDLHLTNIFEGLKEATCGTETITTAFGIQNVYEQQDAAECLEMILRKISPQASEAFQGALRRTRKCSRGHKIIEETNEFWTLPLSLNDTHDSSYSVERSFERIFKSKSFNGRNLVYCNDCEEKTETESECEMVSPQILTLLLKRFDIDYNTGTYFKSDCCVEVPRELQRNNKTYELYAMVNHFGSLRGGHYTATVLSNEDKTWYEFNDTHVYKVKEPFAETNSYNSRTVYLLTYRDAAPAAQKRRLQSYLNPGNGSPLPKTYHGLINQGATCYLNSVLQVLFMTEDFREAVERHTCDNPGTEFIDLHLKSLFKDLQRYDTYTYKIRKKLCIDNVYEQRDAAEYFEKILGLTSSDASQIFHGLLTQKTTCSTCSHETDNDGPFWYLNLPFVNSYTGDYSVVDGIEEYFRASHFNGENHCDVCDAKSDATMKCVIKHHPEVLMLLLKRFEFDYRYMAYVKNNCTVHVPCTLQIPENQMYELYAVVDHFGDLRSGHYTAKIKSQDDDRWYDFNDVKVELLGYQPFQVDNFENSAYLLFYRKKKVHAADTCTQDTGEMSSPGGFPPATSGIYNDQCQDAAKNEPAVAISILRNEETEIKAIVSVGSGGVGLTSDLCKEDQDNGGYSRQTEEDRNDLSYAEKQRDKDEIMMVDEEDKRGNAQADNQTERRASLSGETQLEESVDDPDDVTVSVRRPQEGEGMRNTKRKQEVSNMQPQQVCVDMQKDEEKMVMGVNRDTGGDAGRQDDEGLERVKHNMYEDQEGTQEVGQDYFKSVSVDKQEDVERMETDDEERKAGKVRFYQSPEQLRVEERDVKVDKQQKRGDDEHAQRKGASERQEQDQNRRSVRVTTQRDVGAAKRPKAGNEHIERADSSLRQAGLAGSSRVTENRGDGSVEKSGPSKARTGLSEDAMEGRRSSKQSKTYRGKIIEEEIITTHSGVQTSTVTKNIRIITEEGSSQGSRKSLVDYDEGNAEIESDPKTDAKVTLSKGVHDLRLDDPLLKPKKRRKEQNETKSTVHSNARKMQNVSDEHEQAVGKKHAVKERGEKKRRLWRRSSPLKQSRKDKKKRNKTCGCFSFLCKRRKTADQTSESD